MFAIRQLQQNKKIKCTIKSECEYDLFYLCIIFQVFTSKMIWFSPSETQSPNCWGGVWPRCWVWRSRSHTRTSQHISYLQFVTLLAFILGPLLHYSVLVELWQNSCLAINNNWLFSLDGVDRTSYILMITTYEKVIKNNMQWLIMHNKTRNMH